MTSPKDSGIASGVQQESPNARPMLLNLHEFSIRTKDLTFAEVGALSRLMVFIHRSGGEVPYDLIAMRKSVDATIRHIDFLDILKRISPCLDVDLSAMAVRNLPELVRQ